EVVQYVSYLKQGDGSGNSSKNAADFLNASFWEKINELVEKTPVRVLFAEGIYLRAFTEKALVLNGMGNSNNRLTLEGVAGKTKFNAPDNLSLQKGSLFD